MCTEDKGLSCSYISHRRTNQLWSSSPPPQQPDFTTRHLLTGLATLLHLFSCLSPPLLVPWLHNGGMAFKGASLFSLKAATRAHALCLRAILWGKCQLIKPYMADPFLPPAEPAPLDPPKHPPAELHATGCPRLRWVCGVETHACTQHAGQLGLWCDKNCWVPTGGGGGGAGDLIRGDARCHPELQESQSYRSHRATESQSYRSHRATGVTELQSHRATESQSYRVTELQSHRATESQSYRSHRATGVTELQESQSCSLGTAGIHQNTWKSSRQEIKVLTAADAWKPPTTGHLKFKSSPSIDLSETQSLDPPPFWNIYYFEFTDPLQCRHSVPSVSTSGYPLIIKHKWKVWEW